MSTIIRKAHSGTGKIATDRTESKLVSRQAEQENMLMRTDIPQTRTAIEECVQAEVRRYLEMLDGEEPDNLYRMVIRQAESAVVKLVMTECRGNRTRASEWLGISRGNLRSKLASMEDA